jgi:DNA-binding MarR family transcriptional regulator
MQVSNRHCDQPYTFDKYIYFPVAPKLNFYVKSRTSPIPSKIDLMPGDANGIRKMFETASLGAPENAVGFVLWRIVARYQREIDHALAPLDLTNLQFVTLALSAWFARSGDEVNQAELARFGGIHPMQISHMLKTLENKGLVSRKRSSSDARAKQIEITQSGLHSLRQALPLVIEVQGRLFGEQGHPGGNLHKTLLKLDRELA